MRGMVLFFFVCGVALIFSSAGCRRNSPPAIPGLGGPTTGQTGETLAYSFLTTDPENEELEYMVAWGDTSPVEWSPLYPSGQQVTRAHVFADAGTYHVKVKARDTNEAESEWSDALDVTIAPFGGPPTGVAVSAGPGDSDSTVVISWTTPAEGKPDRYLVYFRSLGDTAYIVIGDTTATSYWHNPHGMTGRYKVAAAFGQATYEAAEQPSTVPIQTDEMALFEIDVNAGMSGFGWNRDSGTGRAYSMAESISSRSVDFYVSDLEVGVGGPLVIVSPDRARSIDPGAIGIVPAAVWRTNGFSNPLSDPQRPLPGYQPPPNANYFIYTQITSQPCYLACFTAGDTLKHYALIQVDSADVSSGRVWIRSWFQLVPGLTLIQH
jgi:hypothetical protein